MKHNRLKQFFQDFYLALILLFLYIPIVTMIVLSFNNTKSRTVWGGFTTRWYTQMFQDSAIMNALNNTLLIAFASALIATVIGTIAAIGINSMKRIPRTIVMGINNIPMLNSDIVTGISLMLAFIAFGISLGFKTVLIAHITFNIPYVILSVMPKLKQTNRYTYEAALDLGASPLYAFFKVVFPDIVPGILSGFLMAFTMSLDDFIITHFTRGAGMDTLSTLIYSQVRGQVNRPKNLLLLFVHIALPAAAIHVQGDDGTALVFLGIGLVMLYAGGLSHWLVAGGLTAGVVGGAALLTLRPGILKGYQFKRILAVLTPDDPALADITYQQNKGAMAIGTGGLTGQGLLSGEHIFVPNAWNDFIFAYLANVLGFLGAAAVLLLLFALCLRTLRTGLQCPDALGCNICVGIFAALFLQCVINIGMNLQVLPVIGVTLPFFSAGGSSVVMMYLCVGIVLSVGMNTRRSKLEMQQIL